MQNRNCKQSDFRVIEEEQMKHEENIRMTKQFLESYHKREQNNIYNEKNVIQFSPKKNSRPSFAFSLDTASSKTTKIRKNKKKKKKSTLQSNSTKPENFMRHEFC